MVSNLKNVCSYDIVITYHIHRGDLMLDKIIVKGAQEHNLKNIDVEIPRNKLVVITGVSGSGKSSLAFDTIYAEGERRYLESLSTYARQFLGEMKKPKVESIEGLSPAISIQQQSVHANPRSIVGTVTEIYDYFRLLWGTIGTPTCPECGEELTATTVDEIVNAILAMPEGTKIMILSPVVQGKKGTHQELLEELKGEGFVRVRIDGEIKNLEEPIALDKNRKHSIDIVIDRAIVSQEKRGRLAESVELALKKSGGLVIILSVESSEEKLFSENFYCPVHQVSFGKIEPRMFSFNAPYGACPECGGLGEKMEFSPDLLVIPHLSLAHGAIRTHPPSQQTWMSMWRSLAQKYGFDIHTPFQELPSHIQNILLYGDSGEVEIHYQSYRMDVRSTTVYEGIIPNLKRRYFETSSPEMREWFEHYMTSVPCPVCQGKRLRKESLAVKVAGHSIMDVTAMTIAKAQEFFRALPAKLSPHQMMIAERVLKEIDKRLSFLVDVGVDYLSLDRKVSTLSGGEFQRTRLATQIGSSLMGVLYVLDEPTIGLHSRDTDKLIRTLEKLRDTGNTVIVVEHDEEMIARADWVIDIGPGAGIYGGQVVAEGTPDEIRRHPTSLTGLYLSGRRCVPMPERPRTGTGEVITIHGAREHNLQNITVSFPLGKFVVVTGVSGSGKSTLVNDILFKALNKIINGSREEPGAHDKITGVEAIDKIIDIDQSPIGRTPRSNPATYTGLFTLIRDLFAALPESRMRGYAPGRFSFNVKGGRCEACQGDGVKKIEMHFLPDVYVPCEVCQGKRYNRETLQVFFKGKNIADVLDMTVDEALAFFEAIPPIKRKLEILRDVGLGYIHLGQPATTLSGGEAQRIKLAKELSRISTGQTLYILDEPTVGLHFDDVRKLLEVLQKLVERGNTVVVIEHNMDVIKVADWIIDLGPEGGSGGGRVIFEGTPQDILHCAESYTGLYLKKYLEDMKRCVE